MVALAPCTVCLDVFLTPEDQRDHYRSDRHVYNIQRKQNGLKPVSADLWAQKLKIFSEQKKEAKKGTDHLKKKSPKSKTPSLYIVTDSVIALAQRTERHCLFDDHESGSMEENLAYMSSKYSFFIPHREYLTKPKELLLYLTEKIYTGYTCLYCDRAFQDSASCLRHMFDKNHTRVGTETFTRSGQYSKEGTEEMLAQLEPFYDFSKSIYELNPGKRRIVETTAALRNIIEEEEELTDEEKIAHIFKHFDEEEKGVLNVEAAANLYKFSQGEDAEYNETKHREVCEWLGNDEGITVEGLAKLYKDQLHTLEEDFEKLGDDWVDIGEDSEFDVKECETQEEFERVMAEFGLEPAQILPSGDLKLPTGNIAAHRDFFYIYRQRGRRMTPEERREKCRAVADGSVRSRLMLGNGNSPGMCHIALSKRQERNQGKQIIAVLRTQQKSDRRRGEKQNIIQKKRTPKFRTQLGDAAGGR